MRDAVAVTADVSASTLASLCFGIGGGDGGAARDLLESAASLGAAVAALRATIPPGQGPALAHLAGVCDVLDSRLARLSAAASATCTAWRGVADAAARHDALFAAPPAPPTGGRLAVPRARRAAHAALANPAPAPRPRAHSGAGAGDAIPASSSAAAAAAAAEGEELRAEAAAFVTRVAERDDAAAAAAIEASVQSLATLSALMAEKIGAQASLIEGVYSATAASVEDVKAAGGELRRALVGGMRWRTVGSGLLLVAAMSLLALDRVF